MLKQIVDAFSYNTSLLWLPLRFYPNCLVQLDILRRAANYRPRWFVIPDDLDQPIQPYDTFYYQVNVNPGSYLWGYMFSSISATAPGGGPVATTAADLLVQAVDACTGVGLFMDFINAAAAHANFNSRMGPVLLTQPRPVLEPGLVNCEISNKTANTITCQLLLLFAEPCRVLNEDQRNKNLEHALAIGAMR